LCGTNQQHEIFRDVNEYIAYGERFLHVKNNKQRLFFLHVKDNKQKRFVRSCRWWSVRSPNYLPYWPYSLFLVSIKTTLISPTTVQPFTYMTYRLSTWSRHEYNRNNAHLTLSNNQWLNTNQSENLKQLAYIKTSL
jgi:hypothetical protein